MKLTPLQSSFCVSFCSHAIAFGLFLMGGPARRPTSVVHDATPLMVNTVAFINNAPPTQRDVSSPSSVNSEFVVRADKVARASVIESRPVENHKRDVTDVMPDPLPRREPVNTTKPQPVSIAKIEETIAIETALPVPPSPNRAIDSLPKPGEDVMNSKTRRGVIAKPDFLRNPKPPYPPLALRRGWEGTVLLEVRVTTNGRAAEVRVKQSSGYSLLDEAAMKAAQDYDYIPAVVDGVAIESRVEFPMPFKIDR